MVENPRAGHKHPKPIDYIKEFKRLKYGENVSNFIKKVIAQSSTIVNTIQNANLSQKRKDALIKLIQKRIREFENAN